jgi:hypothetical protein
MLLVQSIAKFKAAPYPGICFLDFTSPAAG